MGFFRPSEAPAFLSLLLFLGINYFCGYQIGASLLDSRPLGVGLALAMPVISLLAIALVRAKTRLPENDLS